MSRVALEIPKLVFHTEIPVRVSDLNYGNHVGNDTILTMMQEARTQLYLSLGFKNEVSLDGTVGQIVTDAAIQYKSESFLGDVLVISVAIDNFNKYGFDMFYVVTNKETQKTVALGKTGIVCFDYSKRKIAAIPPTVLTALRSLTETN